MAARSIQISLEEKLLEEVDQDPEVRQHGRSAVIRRALRAYLDLKRRRMIELAYDRAYEGKADEILEEFGDLLRGQAWPRE
ncbi:MAG TPA: ribbon-helix-helix protein, CopG family [Polyangiaceae bacterium]|jgi:metal-responsive CopG/Arc/MetJ family transcriptional regulator